jgi:endo-1,4-beta-xylanase
MAVIGSVTFLCAGLVAQPALKEVFQGMFLIGTAMNPAQVRGQDAKGAAIVQKHFNTITAENAMKWERIHPAPGRYEFELADEFVAFGEKNQMFIVGHTLVWHCQTPRWVFETASGQPADRTTLLERMREHISTVVGRYKGRVKGWDVVNEALEEDGSLRASPWLKIIGEDYVDKAFEYAHEADPAAELYYNDFSLENRPKRNGAIALVKQLREKGIHVTGVGSQGHYKMDWPEPSQITEMVTDFAGVGVTVMITELDVDLLPNPVGYQGADVSFRIESRPEWNPYAKGLPDKMQQTLADRYGELFDAFVGQKQHLRRVTFWGVHDKASWLNNWPVPGRTSYPLLFDAVGQPKPAFNAVVQAAGPRP